MNAVPGSVLIVDDESPARARLRQLLTDIGGWQVAGEAAHGRQALDLCQSLDPDVVLLDIRMPEMDGIQVARHLHALASPPAVIFTTAYSDYAIQAFEAQAIGYLVKPVRRERLERALQQASRLSRSGLATAAAAAGEGGRRSHICVRKAKGLRLVPVGEILGFQADQKYVTLMLADGEEVSDETLKDLEAEFPGEFIRIHRNTLVARKFLQRIETTEDGRSLAWIAHREQPLPISRRLLAEVKRRVAGAAG
ncbi:MAG: response regulator transcription factor [Gammaproteobacteria bacterium]|nr:response regulator transcription factor [Gammaproteobacteria bacterium]QOJ33005.1 MAG: response regulator transcription factor [Gammaproteobacteria bacterium]